MRLKPVKPSRKKCKQPRAANALYAEYLNAVCLTDFVHDDCARRVFVPAKFLNVCTAQVWPELSLSLSIGELIKLEASMTAVLSARN